MTRTLLLLSVGTAISGFGQQPMGPSPYVAPDKDRHRAALKRMLPSLASPMARAVEQSLDPVADGDIARLRERAAKNVDTVGIHRKLTVELGDFGRWDETPQGRRIWRGAVHSPGAIGMRVHFTGFDAGQGMVWVHDGRTPSAEIAGPYAGRGIFEDGDFWSETIFGDSIVVEYQPAEGAASGAPPFQVAEISHLFDNVFAPEEAKGSRSAALTCHRDVTCFPEWAETARSVARLVFEADGGSSLCTGTLLNTRNISRIPYLLTANHCIGDDTVARTVQAFWFYQSAQCNGTPPAPRDLPRSNGARMMVTGDENEGDFTLLRLNDIPNGVFFSGWNPQEIAVGTTVTGIHHPAGDYKRISFGQRDSDRIRGPFYSTRWSDGHTEPGSSGSGLFTGPGVLVGTLNSGLRAPNNQTKCDINPDYSFYGRFSTFFPSIRDFLEDRTTGGPNPNPPPPPPTGAGVLTSGVAQSFQLPAVTTGTLTAPVFQIAVPAGATRLTVRVTTQTAGADVDLYVRFGQAPEVVNREVVSDHKSEGPAGDETVVVTATSSPALRAGTYFIRLGLFTNNVVVNGSVVATVESGAPPPAGNATVLTSGQLQNFSLPAVTSPTLFGSGGSLFSIVVPQGATRLTVRLDTQTPDADVDLYVRFGTAPAVVDGRVASDHSSTSEGGGETIVVVPGTTPPLRPGTYFIALGLFTPNTAVRGTITATVETAPVAPPPTGGPTVLPPGSPRQFSLPAVPQPTLFNAQPNLYTVQVPAGARRLQVRIVTEAANVDVDLYVRRNEAPRVADGRIQADYSSETDATGNETITVALNSTPPLQAGTYFIALALFTRNTAARGTITATIEAGDQAPPPTTSRTLTSGQPASFSFEAVNAPTLFSGNLGYQIVVPENGTRLTIRAVSSDPRVDIDLYVRYAQPVDVDADGAVVSDHSSESESGTETVNISANSTPQLRAGIYYISLSLYSTGVPATGTVTATLERASPVTRRGRQITPGQTLVDRLAAVNQPTFVGGDRGYWVEVPAGVDPVFFTLRTSPADLDVDLYVRFGREPEVANGRVEADHRSTGNTGDERITLTLNSTTPPLRPGTYFIALVVYPSQTQAQITLQVDFNQPPEPFREPESAITKLVKEKPVDLTPGKAVWIEEALESPVAESGRRKQVAWRVQR